MFALDTNTLICFFKGSGRVAERLLATAPTEIAIPAISVYEIETGIAKSREPGKRRKQFDQLLELVAILPFDQAAANHAAAVRASLENTGQPSGRWTHSSPARHWRTMPPSSHAICARSSGSRSCFW